MQASLSDKSSKKQVRGSKHLLRNLPGWAIDEDVLKQAAAADVLTVQITDIDTGNVYQSPLSAFWLSGKPINYPNCGHQLALHLTSWEVLSPVSA